MKATQDLPIQISAAYLHKEINYCDAVEFATQKRKKLHCEFSNDG